MSKSPVPMFLPAPGEGKRGEDGHMGYLLRQAAHAYRQRAETALADLDLTPPQFTVLTMLAAYPGLSGADLARLALLTPQTIAVIVGNLDRAGLITREPHPVHGRILAISLTAPGRAVLAKARSRMQTLDDSLLAGLDADHETVVRRWLVTVALPTET
ncbi:MarR family winged helix-turn-helix transcriptional regulator [Oryzibacter oryziterrae]|uniref:MarR family winged helix-turn-helix transcriptional regulator n=1 Tax=Oryzibacter oryziterrae TaxID=2766474 RepID=UPI001F290889|nr:MarR family transcriptional regulator [Oryzibacter oryziterrae]